MIKTSEYNNEIDICVSVLLLISDSLQGYINGNEHLNIYNMKQIKYLLDAQVNRLKELKKDLEDE